MRLSPGLRSSLHGEYPSETPELTVRSLGSGIDAFILECTVAPAESP